MAEPATWRQPDVVADDVEAWADHLIGKGARWELAVLHLAARIIRRYAQ
jgi:hypothetical protein